MAQLCMWWEIRRVGVDLRDAVNSMMLTYEMKGGRISFFSISLLFFFMSLSILSPAPQTLLCTISKLHQRSFYSIVAPQPLLSIRKTIHISDKKGRTKALIFPSPNSTSICPSLYFLLLFLRHRSHHPDDHSDDDDEIPVFASHFPDAVYDPPHHVLNTSSASDFCSSPLRCAQIDRALDSAQQQPAHHAPLFSQDQKLVSTERRSDVVRREDCSATRARTMKMVREVCSGVFGGGCIRILREGAWLVLKE